MSNNEIVEILYKDYDRLMTMALSISRDLRKSKDLVQSACYKLLESNNEKLNRLYDNGKLMNYCYSIIRNQYITDSQENSKFVSIDNQLKTNEVKTNKIDRKQIGALLWMLDKYSRTLFYYYHVNQISIREISNITGITKSKIEYNLWQSKRKLQEKLTPQQKRNLLESLRD